MKLLDNAMVRFVKTSGNTLKVETSEGRRYEPVRCIPLFPITAPDRFISLQVKNGAEYEEFGIIEDMTSLGDRERQTINDDIRFRYFVPEIIDISKINVKNGLETWLVTTDRGEKKFCVTDKHENIMMTDTGIVFVTDIDRLRYKITDIQALPRRAQGLLDKVLL